MDNVSVAGTGKSDVELDDIGFRRRRKLASVREDPTSNRESFHGEFQPGAQARRYASAVGAEPNGAGRVLQRPRAFSKDADLAVNSGCNPSKLL